MSNSTLHIMACIDFSDCSMTALAHAVRLAEPLHARLHLCHIAEGEGLVAATNLGLNTPDTFPVAKEARVRLQYELAQLSASVDAEIHVRLGTAVTGLLSLIREIRPAMVVVCSHGKGLFKQALLGSVSAELARRSPVPVLIVPAPGRAALLDPAEPPAEVQLPSVGRAVDRGDEGGSSGVGIASVGGASVTYR